MKQTNNAIKFLMAQYRAIFNNAYFKGLASAALVTVAMAAGQAQAATSDLATALSGTTADSPAAVTPINGDDNSVSGASGGFIKGITVNSGTLSFSEQTAHVRTDGLVELKSGTTLSLSGSSSKVSGLIGTFDSKDNFNKAPKSQLLVNDANVNVTMSQIQMSKVDLNNAIVTIKTNNGDNADSDWADNAQINAMAAYDDAGKHVEGTGTFNVTGKNSAITLDSGSVLNAAVFNLEGGKIDMKSAADASGASVIRAYTNAGKVAGEINVDGVDINVSGAGNYLSAKTLNIKNADSVITVSGTSTLTLTGTLNKTNLADGGALTDGTVNFTAGKIDLKAADSKLVLDGKDTTGKKGVEFYANGDAQLVGLGAIDLGSKAKFIADKAILDGFVKPGTDSTTGNGGKINFAKAGSQVTIDSDAVVDLSSYGFGSAANADFDVTADSVTGKIIGDKLAITKATTDTLSTGTSRLIKVEADELTLGSSAAESKLSTTQGSVFTQLTAHDKLTLAGSGDKFTIDSGDMFLTNRNADKASVIDGAELAFDHGRINLKGAWESASDITFTGGAGTSNANIFFDNASGVNTSLTLTGTLKNDKTTNTWGAIRAGATTAKSTLDITKATLASTGTTGNMVSFAADKNGVVKVTGEQVTSILKADANTKGFNLGVASGGKLDIQGDFAANFDDFIKFTGTGSTDANKITFGGWNEDQTTVINVGGHIKANKATLTTSDLATPAGTGELNLQATKSDDVKLELAELDITNNVKTGDTLSKDVTIKSGSVLVSSKLNSANKNLVIGAGAALYLETTTSGSVTGLETITASNNNPDDDYELCISGKWDLSNTGLIASDSGAILLDATSGVADVVAKSLKTSSSGTLTIGEGSSLKVTGAVVTENDSVKVRGDSTFTVDYTQANSGTALGKVVVDGSSTLVLDGFTGENISLTDLQAQKGKFLSGTTGLFKITKGGKNVSVTGTATGPEVSFTDAQKAENLEGIYANQTITGVSGSINTTNDWGTVKLAQGETKLDLGTTGSVILNGANSNTNLVADKDGAADVQLGSASMLTVKGSGTIKDVVAAGDNNGTLRVDDNVSLTAGNIGSSASADLSEVVVNANSSLTAKNVFANELSVDGTLAAKDVSLDTLTLDGQASVTSLSLANATNSAEINGQLNVAESVTAAGNLQVNGELSAKSLTLASGKTLAVGQDGEDSKSGLLDVGTLNLAGGSLIIDPAYTSKASVGYVKGTSASQSDIDLVINVGGDVGVGQNAIFVAGMRADDAAAQEIIARYTNAIGSLDKNGNNQIDNGEFGALFIANGQYTVASNTATIVDHTKQSADFTTAFNGTSFDNKFTLGNDSALFVTDEFAQDLLNNASNAVINFAGTNGVLALSNDSKIYIDTALTATDTIDLVSGTNATVSGMTANTIEAANGLLQGTIGADGKVTFALVEANARAKLFNQSNPVQDLTIKALKGDLDKTETGVEYLLLAAKDNGGQASEATARLAVYGGAIQATNLAQQAATDAVADRMSRANPNGSLVFANNAQGGGLWLSPVYKSLESDSFDADGVDYGVDADITGLVLGADSTTESGVRVGGYFNFGSGSIDGQSVGSQVSNDADYFGLGLYAGMTFGQMSFVADAGFTQVSNDIEQTTGLTKFDKVTADTDATAITLGLRGEYKLNVATMDVTPHLGVRYTRLAVDGYDAKADGYTVATTDVDTMQMFAIPFGVTISKDIAVGAWTVKPVFDLTLTANAGDTDAKLDTNFGSNALNLTSEAFDSFTYGATMGIDAKYGENFSVGLNTNYVGSSNADEFGVMGNVRYMF